MKTVSTYILLALTLLVFNACKHEFIDGISPVDPGADETAPSVTVNFPPNGYELQTNDELAAIEIDFEVRDDIEIKTVSVHMDGTELVTYNEFKDYRVFMQKYLYEEVNTGQHLLSVKAIDLDGKETVADVTFTKAPPYVPVYPGEVFYMPFNNEYREMNSLQLATKVGMAGFANGIQGGTAYQGAADAYLTFPAGVLQGSNAMSASFWMKVDKSMDRAGVLVVSPPAADNNDRTKGFRFFREASNGGATQRFKLNAGNGTADSWFDGGAAADVVPNTGEWVHFAFSLSGTEGVVYINGNVAAQGAFGGVDWTNCSQISIMSGAPNWTGWNHKSDGSIMDELRIFNKALSQDEIKTIMLKEQASFYMDFNGDFKENLTGAAATAVGAPGFAYGSGLQGDAYKGADNAYLTFPTSNLQGAEFGASFWMKINAVPDRAGILVMGPLDAANPDAQNVRTSGFRFFREASNGGATQRFKLNAGNGAADSWFDGGSAADVDPTTGEWVHFAFSIAANECRVYIDGTQVSQGAFTGINWTGCDLLSIMSGSPRFNGWGHKSDQSLMDELYLFKKALSTEEVNLLKNEGR